MAFKSGLVTLVGKPNVGKSTLLNALVGHKVSIVSSRPQTTRRRVIGIAQGEGYQIGFIDTPGLHEPHNRLQRAMVEQSRGSLADVDLVVVVVDVSKKPDDIEIALAKLLGAPDKGPARLMCLNKMDLLPAELVVERVEGYCKLFGTEEYMFTDAVRLRNLDKLVEMVLTHLPEAEPLFPEDEFTDQSARFLVSEIIREKVLAATRQEVPHATAVRIDSWEEPGSAPAASPHRGEKGRRDEGTEGQEAGKATSPPWGDTGERSEPGEGTTLHIAATILVERPGQRAILLGKQGSMIKKLGTEARKEIEELLGRHVYLALHVSVKEDWRSSFSMLRELEYVD